MPKTHAVRVQSQNGEIHLILSDSSLIQNIEAAEDFDEMQIKEIMKNEANKPLLLMRSE